MADRLAERKSAAIRIFSNCSNAEELVTLFRPLYRAGVLFIPTLDTPILADQFALTLELKNQILLRSMGVQVEPFANGLATGGYEGIAIRFSDVSPSGKVLLEQLANTKDGTIPFGVPSGATDSGRIFCTISDVDSTQLEEITNVEPPRKRSADTMEPTFVRKDGKKNTAQQGSPYATPPRKRTSPTDGAEEITNPEITQPSDHPRDDAMAALVGANAQGPEGSAVLALGDLLTDGKPKRRFLDTATEIAPTEPLVPVQGAPFSPPLAAPADVSAPRTATPRPPQGLATPMPPQGYAATPMPHDSLGLAVTAPAAPAFQDAMTIARPTSTTDMVESSGASGLGIVVAAIVAASLGLGTGYLLWGYQSAPVETAQAEATDEDIKAQVAKKINERKANANVVPSDDAGVLIAAAPLLDANNAAQEPDAAAVVAPADTADTKAKTCTASITSNPSGAQVFVAGELLGESPYSGSIACAPIALEFKLKGYKARTVKFDARKESEVSTKLAKKKLVNYRIKVSSIPRSSLIRLNGKRAGWTPLVLELPADEEVTLTFVKRGFTSVDKKVTPKRNGKVKARLRRGKNRRRR